MPHLITTHGVVNLTGNAKCRSADGLVREMIEEKRTVEARARYTDQKTRGRSLRAPGPS